MWRFTCLLYSFFSNDALSRALLLLHDTGGSSQVLLIFCPHLSPRLTSENFLHIIERCDDLIGCSLVTSWLLNFVTDSYKMEKYFMRELIYNSNVAPNTIHVYLYYNVNGTQNNVGDTLLHV